MENEVNITTTNYKSCDIVKIIGRVDTYSAPKLQEVLDNLMETGRFNLILDMGEVDFLSSKGLWVLTETQKKCKKLNRGELVLANVIDRIKESFKLVGMDGYFEIYDDLTPAVGHF